MKKLFLAVVFFAVVVTFLSNEPVFAQEKNLKIAMILWRGETLAERGFKDGLRELGYSVQFTIMRSRQDRKKMGRVLRTQLKPTLHQYDYIYTFGTTVTKAAKYFIKNKVPQIFNIIVAPVRAGIVKTMESSGGNISGVTNRVPFYLQIEAALKVMKIKKLGLFFNPREKNSMLVRQSFQKLAKSYNFQLIDLRSPPALKMLETNLQKLKDKSVVVDAVYLPNDSFLLSKAKLVGAQLRAAKVRSFGAVQSYVNAGALMGLVPDYYKLGKAAAKIVDRHEKGEKLQNIPVHRTKAPRLVINKTTAKALNVKVAENLLKKAILVE
jgi:ABC-type uncharacterized transport system substrate-binding protein